MKCSFFRYIYIYLFIYLLFLLIHVLHLDLDFPKYIASTSIFCSIGWWFLEKPSLRKGALSRRSNLAPGRLWPFLGQQNVPLSLFFCINNNVPNATGIAKSDVYKGRPIGPEDGEKLHDAKVLRRPWGCNSWSLLFCSLVTCYATCWFWFKSWIPKKNILKYVLRFHVVRDSRG